MTKRKRRRPRLTTRVLLVDGEWFLIGHRDEEGFHAVRLSSADRDLVVRMQEENEIEMEAALVSRR
jgi:hypothetical protein